MADRNSHLLRSAGTMAAMTILSRLTGYARDCIQAVILGAADSSDAFIIAYRIPNLLRRLVGEGAMTAAFVPVFTEIDARRARDRLWQFSARFFNLLAAALAALTLIGVVFAPWVVRAMAYGFKGIEGKEALTIHLTRLMFPYLFFIGLSALQMAILNSLDRFALPAFTPVLLNLSIIAAALGLSRRMGEPADAFALGVLVGGFLQMAAQVPALRREGMRLSATIELRDPDVWRVLRLMLPGIFGAGIYQINLMIDSQFASFLSSGSVSYLFYANRVTELVLGIFVVSLSTAILPSLSRDVQSRSIEAARRTLDFGMRQTAFIALPACAGLVALAAPIVEVLFERGRFGPEATRFTAEALVYYSLGLLPVAALKVVLSAFYARQDTRTPVWVAGWTLLLHLLLNFLLIAVIPMEHRGLALSTSLSALFNLVALAWVHARRWGAPWSAGANVSILRCCAASAVMGVACRAALGAAGFHATIGFAQVLILVIVITLGAVLYTALLVLLGAPEPAELLTALRRGGPGGGVVGGSAAPGGPQAPGEPPNRAGA
jgi:putative peptidoglycan lipid II flippase